MSSLRSNRSSSSPMSTWSVSGSSMPSTSGRAAMNATPISTAAATMTSSASTSTSCGIVSRVPLRLGRQTYDDDRLLVMAIVNRTPDSFYDKGATFDDAPAMAAVGKAVADGADLVDIGGVKAGPGDEVDTAEEIRRVVPFVAAVRAAYPDLV